MGLERLRTGVDGVVRCWWCGDDPLYVRYHDDEWGHPVTADRRLFEKLCLEGFQAGLSWITVLRKREAFRAGFAGFDWEMLRGWGDAEVERLVGDAGIIRHRGKIESVLNNARCMPALLDEFGSLYSFVSGFRPDQAQRPTVDSPLPATIPESVALSKALKRRGWSFVGPTTVYAFMQAMGLVDDHIVGCERTPA